MKLEDIHIGMEVIIKNKTHTDGKDFRDWKKQNPGKVSGKVGEIEDDTKPIGIIIEGDRFTVEDLEPMSKNLLMLMEYKKSLGVM
jgi:hypothetical protein